MGRFLVSLLIALLLSTVAQASDGVRRSERKLWIDAEAANAAAGLRTFTLLASGGSETAVMAGGYNLAVVHLDVDGLDGVTAIGMVCSASDDAGSTLFVIQDCDVSSGVCTSADASWTRAIAGFADTKIVWRVDITGYRYVSCVVTATAGTANESITASGYLTTK